MAGLSLRAVRKSFGGLEVIRGVDFDVADGEFCVFVGPSGCGKSTLLRMIAGLEEPSEGAISIGNRDVTWLPPAQRGISMVFQSYALYPHMSVRDNIAFGLKMAKTPRAEIDLRTIEAANLLQLTDYLDRRPAQLSGGQRQRVAIGRAIVREPDVFLFDEPLSNLDAALRVQMRIEIARLHQNLKATMVYVTHDQVEAMTMADKIVVLNGGQIEQIGSPLELYHRPNNLFVATFIGSPKMNLFAADATSVENGMANVVTRGGERLTIPTRGTSLLPGPVTIGVRPEHIELVTSTGDNKIEGKVALSEHLGGETMLYVDSKSLLQCVVKADGLAPQRLGDSVIMHLPAATCHIFGADGKALINGSLI
jgi:multiple sugar transport system ATP-binding protein